MVVRSGGVYVDLQALVERDRAHPRSESGAVRLVVRDKDVADGTLRCVCSVVAGLSWADLDPARAPESVAEVMLVVHGKWVEEQEVEVGRELVLHRPWENVVVERLPVLLGLNVQLS